jgi:hypothetical protein
MHHLATAQATIDPEFMQFVRLLRALYSTCGLFPEDPERRDAAPVGGCMAALDTWRAQQAPVAAPAH